MHGGHGVNPIEEPRPAARASGSAPADLASAAVRFAEAPPERLLAWAVEVFAPDLCLATSFGPQSIALMHMMSALRPETTVFYLDTGLLFPETHELRDRLSARLGVTITRVTASLSLEQQAGIFGAELWSREPDRCCHLRKVLPLRRFLANQRAWITGIRATQTSLRARAARIEWDAANGLVKLNPMLHWTHEQVWAYIRAHDLPFSRLHLQGYPSIGCQPCTRPVRPGDDPRAGRWAGSGKTECGIHLSSRGACGPGGPGLLSILGPIEEVSR
jgi:phosphoadenosine phosphosulfate reductase